MKKPIINAPGPIRDLLDDFARMPEGKRTFIAGGIALMFHAAIFIGGGALIFRMQKETAAKPVEKKSQLEVTLFTATPEPKPIAATPEPKPEKLTQKEEQQLVEMFQQLPQELQREFIDVDGLAQKKNLSKRALLESWADSIAGSRLPGKGDGPLPTQDGKNLPFTEFKNQDASLGENSAPIFQPQPIPNDEVLRPPNSRPVPKVAEVAQTKPTELMVAATPRPSRLVLAQAPTPPPSMRKVREASADEIPLYLSKPDENKAPDVTLRPEPTPEPPEPPKPSPTPEPTPEPKIKPTPVPVTTPVPKPAARDVNVNSIMARLPNQPRPQPVQNPGYAPHQVQTKIDGGSAPPGENGVDAVATAAGKYKKNMKSTVGSRWTYFVHDAKFSSLIVAGQTTVDVTLDPRGKILRCKVSENTSNAVHAQICERAFLESQKDIDPPPAELLNNGVYEESYTFTLY